MRVDLFLKKSAIIKRRTLAHEACLRGAVKINGRIARPGNSVKAGDTVTVMFREGERIISAKILKLPADGRLDPSCLEVQVVDSF